MLVFKPFPHLSDNVKSKPVSFCHFVIWISYYTDFELNIY